MGFQTLLAHSKQRGGAQANLIQKTRMKNLFLVGVILSALALELNHDGAAAFKA
jgi:hypothetical protein